MIILSEIQKKIIFIIFFVLFTLGTGYALYYFFFSPLATVTPPTESTDPSYTGTFNESGTRDETTQIDTNLGTAPLPVGVGSQPTSAQTGTNILLDQVTQAVSMSADGLTRYYNPEDGRFYSLKEDGTSITLSDRQFLNVDNISWSAVKDEAILEFPDGSNIYYDFQTERQVTLPSHWQDFEFAPTESKIVAKSIGLDQNNRYLVSADANGNELTALYQLGDNADRVIPSWSPNNTVIGFSKTGDPQPDNGEEILLLGKNHEQFRPLTVAGKGFLPSWSPDGKQLLYSVYHERDGLRPMLWISDASGSQVGQNRRKLNINTWADKCAWADKNTIYCGVPISLPAGAALDRDIVSSVSDDIYKINLQTGLAQKVNKTANTYSINTPAISQDGSKLIFTDSSTGKLIGIDL
ncbi:MAG: hypothetical protein P1P90_06180 [Patescibacteria group bacterium]|nr:hypothetical protein [Patescibacteria group bacterium]